MRNKLLQNKKGQIFTILAILLLGLLFVSFELYSSLKENQSDKTRVSTMNSFLYSLEQNLERQLYISGFRILFLAESEITSKGEYIDVNSFFQEAFFNGTIDGVSNDILIGATYSDLINSLNDKANKINAEVEISNSTFYVNQTDPWNIDFNLISDFVIRDQGGLVRWDKKQNVLAKISVENFEDPIYTMNTYAKVSKKITRTIYDDNYVNGIDISNLLSHINLGYYSANTDAPSFLKRLEGDLSSDPNGIESFVYLPSLSQQGINTFTKSTMDYIYFSNNNPTFYSVTGMPSWFRIDDEDNHLNKYEVNLLTN